jgi:hypothetical protein
MPPSRGFRISDTSGFQLIEHGHWSPLRCGKHWPNISALDGQHGIQLNTTSASQVKKSLQQIFGERHSYRMSMPQNPGSDLPSGLTRRI